jgi:ABC-type glycerol-3-phosphate transport system permease component
MNMRKLTAGQVIAYVVLLTGALTMIVPFLWMLSTSFKSLGEVFIFPPKLLGERIVWGKLPSHLRPLPLRPVFPEQPKNLGDRHRFSGAHQLHGGVRLCPA